MRARWLRPGLTLLSVGVLTATLGGWAAPEVLLGVWLSSFRVLYLWLALACVGLAVWCRAPRVIMMSGLTAGLNLLWIWPCLDIASNLPAGEKVATVLLANVQTSNRDYARVLERIREVDPDIVILQEVDERWIEAMGELRERFGEHYELPREDNFGIAVYATSIAMDLVMPGLDYANVPSVAIQLGNEEGDTLGWLLATHPVPPVNADYLLQRNQHIGSIADWAEHLGGPVAVVGDLNMTPWSPTMRRLEWGTGMRHSRRGEGILTSWPYQSVLMTPFRIPLDHALAGRGWMAHNTRTLESIGSDHLPLLVDISWTP